MVSLSVFLVGLAPQPEVLLFHRLALSSVPMTVSLPSARRFGDRRTQRSAADVFAGPGSVRAYCFDFDWVNTPLGPVETWSLPMQTAVQMIMAAPGAISLYAGLELTTLYNDACCDVLGAKHPAALGQPAREVSVEIWTTVSPQFHEVRDHGAVIDLRTTPFQLARGTGGTAELPGSITS